MVNIAATANKGLIEQLKGLQVRGILKLMAERGQILELKCEMPKCFCPDGRKAFVRKGHPPDKWAPSADHYPISKALKGTLKPWNVRVGHVLCNQIDAGWRSRVIALLKRREMSLKEIADDLNLKHIQVPDGAKKWTAARVRRALAA
jgi:hypothetical protein